ncbi:JAB1/Mov34/MPN/PAD-1 ubiquitin protease-domain-containing protein, partial [Entophlyctis helioformis]
MASSADIARKRFELENNIKEVNAADDIFHYNAEEQKEVQSARPWTKDPNFFKKVRISAVALVKMVTHARSGGNIEVMGVMQGKVMGDTMVIMDAFALPVEGTETRVNAQAQGYEYMVEYMTKIKEVGRLENAIGWYHSHPGYGCWLSGIDVSTQMLNQKYQEPFVAVVIDPNRTISAGKVEIGAFRTYPEDYKPSDGGRSEYQSIPLDKIEDFGVHANQYYPLDVSFFKSTLDNKLLELLWNKYWVNTLSSTRLITNREYRSLQIKDLAEKIEQSESAINARLRGDKPKGDDEPTLKLARDSTQISMEATHGLISQVLKDILFNSRV